MSLGHIPEECEYCHSLGCYHDRPLYACFVTVAHASFNGSIAPYSDINLYVTDSNLHLHHSIAWGRASLIDNSNSSSELIEAKRRAIEQGWLRSANASLISISTGTANGDALDRIKK